jgi:hypothetical protein
MNINDMENPGDPDPDVVAREYLDSLRDPEPPQAEGSEAQNPGNNQETNICNSGRCKKPAAPGRKSCENCLRGHRESMRSAEMNFQKSIKFSFN